MSEADYYDPDEDVDGSPKIFDADFDEEQQEEGSSDEVTSGVTENFTGADDFANVGQRGSHDDDDDEMGEEPEGGAEGADAQGQDGAQNQMQAQGGAAQQGGKGGKGKKKSIKSVDPNTVGGVIAMFEIAVDLCDLVNKLKIPLPPPAKAAVMLISQLKDKGIIDKITEKLKKVEDSMLNFAIGIYLKLPPQGNILKGVHKACTILEPIVEKAQKVVPGANKGGKGGGKK